MRRVALLASVAAGVLVCPMGAAATSATATVVVTAQVAGRTSLTVSSERLLFEVRDSTGIASTSVDFSAAARTRSGGEVTLSLLRGATSAAGGNPAQPDLFFAGNGHGVVAGTVAEGRSAIAGRWTGSGRRAGRLVFTLRTPTTGEFVVPVHFVLSAP